MALESQMQVATVAWPWYVQPFSMIDNDAWLTVIDLFFERPVRSLLRHKLTIEDHSEPTLDSQSTLPINEEHQEFVVYE